MFLGAGQTKTKLIIKLDSLTGGGEPERVRLKRKSRVKGKWGK